MPPSPRIWMISYRLARTALGPSRPPSQVLAAGDGDPPRMVAGDATPAVGGSVGAAGFRADVVISNRVGASAPGSEERRTATPPSTTSVGASGSYFFCFGSSIN